ncbi:MAG: S1 RNA-binding domain-containing protein [Clostridia bacterium]|nr:S1 RNA-binding domain-containing protein [Clostridia bacterium]
MTEAYYTEGTLLNTEKNREYISSLEGLERAMHEGRILEAVAVRAHGAQTLTVELGELYGTIEKNEVQLTNGEAVKDIAVITRVGKPVCFKVTGIERRRVGEPIITLSRRAAQFECAKHYLAGLLPGDVIDAKVTHLEHFGAFVDIGCGIVSLLSIDCMSVSRITHPADRLSVGSQISVVVRAIDKDSTGLPTRLFVTRRELLGTWEENAALFSVGQTVTGIVRSVEPYGIFVELTPNLAGLAEYRDDVSVGQTAAVYIKNIIPERMKVKLVIIDPQRGIAPQNGKDNIICSDERHITHWKYSPEECERVVETVFE